MSYSRDEDGPNVSKPSAASAMSRLAYLTNPMNSAAFSHPGLNEREKKCSAQRPGPTRGYEITTDGPNPPAVAGGTPHIVSQPHDFQV